MTLKFFVLLLSLGAVSPAFAAKKSCRPELRRQRSVSEYEFSDRSGTFERVEDREASPYFMETDRDGGSAYGDHSSDQREYYGP